MTTPFIPFASSAALILALSQTMLASTALAAEPQPAAPPAQYPTTAQKAASTSAPQSNSTPAPAETARSQIEESRAAMPESPDMAPRYGMSPEHDAAMRQWQEDMQARMQERERIRNMTPEERQAMREERWKQMRADAAERGIEMPETPPWKEAEKRRQEMAQRFEEYRKTVEQMTDEQREAAQAIFGRMPPRMAPPMPRQNFGQGYEPWGYPGDGPYQNEPWGMHCPPMMPYQGAPGDNQGPPPPQAGDN